MNRDKAPDSGQGESSRTGLVQRAARAEKIDRGRTDPERTSGQGPDRDLPPAQRVLGPILDRGIKPVRPFPSPWLLASLVIAMGLAGPLLFLLVMGFRVPRAPVIVAAVVAEFLAGAAVVTSAFFWSFPSRAPSGVLAAWVLAAVLATSGIAFFLPHLVTGFPVAGVSVSKGLACVGWEFGAALPLVVLILWLLVQMPPFHLWLTGFLGGLGAGLVADAANHLHCPALDPAHTVTWHLGGVLLLALFSAVSRWGLAKRQGSD